MPGRDRKGPLGQGPMSGRGQGLCSSQGQGQMAGGGRQRRGSTRSRGSNCGGGFGGRGARWVHSWFRVDGLSSDEAIDLSSNHRLLEKLDELQNELQGLKQKIGLDNSEEDKNSPVE